MQHPHDKLDEAQPQSAAGRTASLQSKLDMMPEASRS